MNEQFDELMRLKTNNPELEIMPVVSEEVYSGVFAWDIGAFGKAEVNEYLCHDECIYRDDQIIDALSESFADDPEFEGLTTEEFDEIIEKEIENKRKIGEIQKAIFVSITLP